jgi:hypothetical protein
VAELLFLSQIDRPLVKSVSVAFPLCEEQALCEAVHLRSCSAGLNKAWIHTSTLLHLWCGVELSTRMTSPYVKADKTVRNTF